MKVDVVLDERSPHEPDEDFEPDEPTLGPEIPDVEPEIDGFFGPSNTPKALLTAFWSLVVLFNVGLLATSLGAMLVWFRGDWRLGGALLAVGLLALARGLHRYLTTDPYSFGERSADDPSGAQRGDRDRPTSTTEEER